MIFFLNIFQVEKKKFYFFYILKKSVHHNCVDTTDLVRCTYMKQSNRNEIERKME